MPKKSNLKNADPNEVAKHLGLKKNLKETSNKKRFKDKVKKDLKAAEETEKLLKSNSGEEPGTSNR